MNPWLAVFLGGGAGSVVRFAISRGALLLIGKGVFPWATLASNLLATAFLAWLVMRTPILQPGRETWQALLVIGFCGGFSTLSTFSMENYALIRDGHFMIAVLNILISVTMGILAFYSFARTS
jgi:CrcB protein